jgi:hypothetical protein
VTVQRGRSGATCKGSAAHIVAHRNMGQARHGRRAVTHRHRVNRHHLASCKVCTPRGAGKVVFTRWSENAEETGEGVTQAGSKDPEHIT